MHLTLSPSISNTDLILRKYSKFDPIPLLFSVILCVVTACTASVRYNPNARVVITALHSRMSFKEVYVYTLFYI